MHVGAGLTARELNPRGRDPASSTGCTDAMNAAIRIASLANRLSSVTVRPMTTIATCSNPAEAMLLKSLLEANEITVYVPDELTAQSAPHFSGSGIRIQVDDQQAAVARRLLEEAENTETPDLDDEAGQDDGGKAG